MPEIVNPETHHEKSDVNVGALLKFFVIFVVFSAVTHGLLYMLFGFFRAHFRDQTMEPLTAVARPVDAAVPPHPRLQPFETRNVGGQVNPPNTNTPVTDMEQMRAAEEKALHEPAWIDRQKGTVRLPIEVAKQLAVQRLATPPPPPPTTTGAPQP
jgi:hypothetical protein